MNQRFLKFISLVSLSLCISLAPLLACACLEEVRSEAHACCPDAPESSPEEGQNNLGGKECCEFLGYPGKRNSQVPILEEVPTASTLAAIPPSGSLFSKLTPTPSIEIACDGGGDPSPPQTYLKNHSFLL